MKELLQNEADPNATDIRGFTPLHLCCMFGLEDLITVLLHHSGKNFFPLRIKYIKKIAIKFSFAYLIDHTN